MPGAVLWFFAVAVGATIGSFVNVCIHRLPRRVSVVHPGSACPACARPIAWYDNIPVVSYLLLRGRCRGCRAPISPQYPLVEASTAALFALLFARHGLSADFVLRSLLSAGLVALIVIDARHQILPNAITLPGIAVGLVSSPLRADGTIHPERDAIIGCVLGYAIPWTINACYLLWQGARGVPKGRREDGIGRGDFKLLAMIGAFLGTRLLLFTIFFGAISGALYGVAMMVFGSHGWKSKVPFGVFLGGAAILALFVGEPWVGWYAGLLGLSP
jgi:leader peptidase (prepilin peptidase) / N-methyltransferase